MRRLAPSATRSLFRPNPFSSSHRSSIHPPLPCVIAVPPNRAIHVTPSKQANPLPITATGPPPAPPQPTNTEHGDREERRKRVREAIKDAQQGHGGTMGKVGGGDTDSSALRRRFWKDVEVRTAEDGRYTIHLDARAVRAPLTKQPLLIPASKPHLATAIAAEWDALSSAQQALKPHLVPLTALAARALDLEAENQAVEHKPNTQEHGTVDVDSDGEHIGGRAEVTTMLMRYLDTDTLLCLEPARDPKDGSAMTATDAFTSQFEIQGDSNTSSSSSSTQISLRALQLKTLNPILAFLTNQLWPGVTIRPVLDGTSLVPASQDPQTLAVIRGWLDGLSAWELAGLECAVLAGKSFCVGARLIAEWSEGGAGLRSLARQKQDEDHQQQEGSSGTDGEAIAREAEERQGRLDGGEGMREGLGTRRLGASRGRFGIDEACEACSLEVRWQTGRWGEVEDTHDVEKEDLRRQMGSAVVLVSGTGSGSA